MCFSAINGSGPAYLTARFQAEIKRSRDRRLRREVELDLQLSPEEIMSRELELGCESWTSFASSCPSCSSTAVPCKGHCLCDSVQAQHLKQQLRSAQVAGQWRGDTANTSIVLAAVHVLSGLFRAVSAVEPSLFCPLPTLSPSLISHLASVDVKQQLMKKNYLSELLHAYTPSCTLRSSSDTRMLEIQQYKRKTHGFRTFSCFGPDIWNSLPQDLRLLNPVIF